MEQQAMAAEQGDGQAGEPMSICSVNGLHTLLCSRLNRV